MTTVPDASEPRRAEITTLEAEAARARRALAWHQRGAARGLVSYGALTLYEHDLRRAELAIMDAMPRASMTGNPRFSEARTATMICPMWFAISS